MKTPNPDHPIRNTLKHLALILPAMAALTGFTHGGTVFQLDFSSKATPAQTGWQSLVGIGSPSGSFSGFTDLADGNITVSLTNIVFDRLYNNPGNNPNATATVDFPGTAPDSMYGDLVGANNTTPINITVAGLKAGAYTFTTHHLYLGPTATPSKFNLDVQDADSSAFGQSAAANIAMGIGVGSENTNGTPPQSFNPTVISFQAVSNGTDPIILRMTRTVEGGTGFGTKGWFGINGLEIVPEPTNLTVKLDSPANNQVYLSGTSITATATVVSGTEPYTVEFFLDSGSGFVSQGTDAEAPYEYDLGALAGGSYQIKATVTDSARPTPGTAESATNTFTVTQATPTTTTVTSSGSPSTYGDSVTFTATVASVPPSQIPTGGTVQFYNGPSPLGSPVAVNTTTGQASIPTSLLGVVGPHNIEAYFSGYQIYEASTASPITQVVNKAPLTVTAQDVSRLVNTANPDPLPYEITGFKNGQTLGTSGVSGTPTLSTTAVEASPVGTYPITCAVGSLAADNYSFTTVDATLTVTNLTGQLGVFDVSANGGINPATGLPWAKGDTYRLVFVTSGTTTCDSTDIATYNAFVQGLADAAGLGTSALGPVTWKVVGSTATVDARDNTGTNPGVNGVGEPVLRMDGKFVIAKNYSDLWDGINASHVTGQNYLSVHLDENGVVRTDDRVRTGSGGNGTVSGLPLGNSDNVQTGRNFAPDFYGGYGATSWMQDWNATAASAGRVYAMSGILSIVSTTPAGYDTWADANGATGQTPEQDHDNDGVKNGIEYFMGETGSSFTALPGLDATNMIAWTMSAAFQGTYEVQTSPDLATWTNVDPRPTPYAGKLSYSLPPGAEDGKSFIRLLVTPAP